MGGPIIFGDMSGLGQGIATAGSALASALANKRAMERQQRQQEQANTLLNSVISGLDPSASPIQTMSALSQVLGQLPQEQAKLLMDLTQPLLKSQIEQEGDLNFFKMFGGDAPVAIDGDQETTYKPTRSGFDAMSKEQLVLASTSKNQRIAEGAKAQLKKLELDQKQENELWNYKPSQEFIKTIEEEAKDADFGNQVADEIIEVVQSDKVDPRNPRTFLAGQFGEKLPFLFTQDSAKLKFLEKLQAKGLKNYFPRPTEREFFFINAAQAQLGKTKEANLAVATLQKKFNNIPIRLAEVKDEIIEENGGVPPRDLVARVRKRSKQIKDELITSSAAIAYKYGDEKEHQAAKRFLKDAESPLLSEKRFLTEEASDRAFLQANGDLGLYEEILREQGYEL